MKLFRLIGTMTIVAAVAATMAVSASALTANYADNKVTLGDVAAADKGDYTVVITSAEEGNDTTEGDIFQLAQSEAAPTELAVPADLEPGKYYVRVGGYEAGYQNAAFVKALESATVESTVVNENTEDAEALYYGVHTTKVPSGLKPWWCADVLVAGAAASEYKEVAANEGWASIEGGVKLYLVYQGTDEATLSNVKLIWK